MAALSVVVIGGLIAFGPLHGGRSTAAGNAPPSLPAAGPPPSQPSPSTIPNLAPGWVSAENAKPGTTDWHLVNPSRNGAIEGYAGVVSAQRGDTVTLYVSTKASTYTVELFRMGYYGGTGARLVWTSPSQVGVLQARPTVARTTNMVSTSWAPSLTVPVDPSWPPGDYLFKLVADTGAQSYVPLTVRDDTSHAALLINNSVTTWQAYNLWGGADLYGGRGGRSEIVSFDRPYEIGDGSGDFLGNEFPFVSLVESLGLDVTYTTDVDLHEHPELVTNHRAFVSLGHDEYWSTAMRDGVEAARDQGVNLGFFGANAVYRHIRLQPSPLGPDRQEVNYRSAKTDPLSGVDNAEVTVSWRQAPVNRPENTLLGELYQCNPVRADFIPTDLSAWVYAGTNFTTRSRIIALIGSEYDGFVPSMPGPRNVEIFAHSPLRCRGIAGYSDFTYYTAPSGAGVIDVGTNNWVPLLTNPWSQPALVQMTENILTAFAAGPAGLVHPSTSNYKTLPRGSFPPAPLTPGPEEAPVTVRPSTGSTTTTSRHATSSTARGPSTTAGGPSPTTTSPAGPTTTAAAAGAPTTGGSPPTTH